MQAKEVVLGKSTGRLPVRPPSRGERGVASVVSTSRHCHLGGSTDTISAHFPDVCAQRRAMMPKLFGQLRAFLFCGDERTCRPQTHMHRILNTEWQATRAQLANCKECSRSIYPLSIDVLCVFWAIEMPQRMRPGGAAGCPQTSAPIQGAVADVHLADNDCLQFRPDAIAQTATTNPYAVG